MDLGNIISDCLNDKVLFMVLPVIGSKSAGKRRNNREEEEERERKSLSICFYFSSVAKAQFHFDEAII